MIRWEVTGNPVKSRVMTNFIEIKRSIFDSNFEKTLFEMLFCDVGKEESGENAEKH